MRIVSRHPLVEFVAARGGLSVIRTGHHHDLPPGVHLDAAHLEANVAQNARTRRPAVTRGAQAPVNFETQRIAVETVKRGVQRGPDALSCGNDCHRDAGRDQTILDSRGRRIVPHKTSDEAEPLFRRAIASGEKALGAEHPHTQRYHSHYARLLLVTGRAAEALRLGNTALATDERVNGPSHPWTKDSAAVTADALAALGRADEAKALREKHGIEGAAI
jgi:hypothetical protein